MSSEFYLAQRFWNAIELGDRLFVDNEGVASLNFQEGDKLQEGTGTLPAFRAAEDGAPMPAPSAVRSAALLVHRPLSPLSHSRSVALAAPPPFSSKLRG